MHSSEGERRGAAARVADEMEAFEAVTISIAQDPGHLRVEAEVGKRLLACIHL